MGEPIRHHQQRAHHIGLERDRSPAAHQQGPGRETRVAGNRDGQRHSESVMLEQGVGSAEAGPDWTTSAVWSARPRMPPSASGSSGRRKPRWASTLRERPGGLEDCRAVGAPMGEGAVDPQDTGFGRGRAPAHGQQAFQTSEAGTSGSSRRTPGGSVTAATPTAWASASRRPVMPARALRISPSDPSSPLTVGSIGRGRSAVNGSWPMRGLSEIRRVRSRRSGRTPAPSDLAEGRTGRRREPRCGTTSSVSGCTGSAGRARSRREPPRVASPRDRC